MSEESRIKIWLFQIRAPFLVLAVVLGLIGIAAAGQTGPVDPYSALLVLLGVVLAHVSVNLFNELSDHQTGIDRETVPTPFSGGSKMMQTGKTTPKSVRIVAYATLLLAALIGFYFCLKSGWLLIVFMIAGAIAIRFYTSHLSRWLIGELVSGLTLGSFVVMGTYYALTATLEREVILLSIVPGILTALLLFLNEFPDWQADQKGGRHHLVIHLGTRVSSRLYSFMLIVVFFIIVVISRLEHIPDTVLLAMFTLPLGVAAAVKVLKHHDDPARLVPAQAMNVALVILTDLLLAIGYFMA